jgi:hypothetical protein
MTAIFTFLELMRKQGRATDDDIDKVKKKGHLSTNEAKKLKEI